MIVLFWGILVIAFLSLGFYLTLQLSQQSKNKEFLSIIQSGVKTALETCGFLFKSRKGKIELYKWIILSDEVCEECLERTTWPAMDIADWMKAGLPDTPDGESFCGNNCQCELFLVETIEADSHPIH